MTERALLSWHAEAGEEGNLIRVQHPPGGEPPRAQDFQEAEG
eukprot:CAMPEP_0194309438 /NCGR_PEP_ID=MMETSP0171-20130528/6417_1 /TAXON_ID=218684 /ORGANISM="Corethron pennatum, Strain L29A3" /LENGTH=41 /DNA_ID= /DNA_START= /DNA_END= /DNA_ORIENTATION=